MSHSCKAPVIHSWFSLAASILC